MVVSSFREVYIIYYEHKHLYYGGINMKNMSLQERMQRVIDTTMSLTIELTKMDCGNGDITAALDIARKIQNDEIELINLLNELESNKPNEEEKDLKVFEFMDLK